MRPRSKLLCLVPSGAVLALGGPWLAAPPFVPDEARAALTPAVYALAHRLHAAPELVARAPGLLAVAVAATLLALAARSAGALAPMLVLASLSPTLVLAGRTAGPWPYALLPAALACLFLARADRTGAWSAAILLAAAVALTAPWHPVASPDRLLALALGAWGVVLGPALPPWRLDVAIPVLMASLPLAWLGAGPRALSRTLGLVALLAAGAFAGYLGGSVAAAALAPAPLVPVFLLLVARGVRRLPASVPRAMLSAVAVGAAGVGLLDIHLGRDLLDPSRRVAWDEAARMLAVLEGGKASVETPDGLPPTLAVYAPGIRMRDGLDPGDQADRILLVSWGHRGGLATPAARRAEGLEKHGYSLEGELAMGETEPGYAALVRRLTGSEPASAYLRIRRYQR